MPRNGFTSEQKEHIKAYHDSVEEYTEAVRQVYEEVLSALPKNFADKLRDLSDKQIQVEGEIHERAKQSGLGTTVFGRIYRLNIEDVNDIRNELEVLAHLRRGLEKGEQ